MDDVDGGGLEYPSRVRGPLSYGWEGMFARGLRDVGRTLTISSKRLRRKIGI